MGPASNQGKYRELERSFIRAKYPKALQQMATVDIMRSTLPQISSKPTYAQNLRRKSTLIARKYANKNPSSILAPNHSSSRSYASSSFNLDPYLESTEDVFFESKPSVEPIVSQLDRSSQRLFHIPKPLAVMDYKYDSTKPLALRGSASVENACRGLATNANNRYSIETISSSRKKNPIVLERKYMSFEPIKSPVIVENSQIGNLYSKEAKLPAHSTPAPNLHLRNHSAKTPPNTSNRSRYLGTSCTAKELSKILSDPSNGEFMLPVEPYNEVYPGLFIGDMATALCTSALRNMGITHVLNAAQKDPRPGYQLPGYYVNTNAAYYRHVNIKFLGVPATDVMDYDISQFFHTGADFIEEALNENGKVLVHCHQGISRSAALAIAFLMIHRGMTAQEAVKTVRSGREVIPNPSFLRQLCELNDRLKGERGSRYGRYLY